MPRRPTESVAEYRVRLLAISDDDALKLDDAEYAARDAAIAEKAKQDSEARARARAEAKEEERKRAEEAERKKAEAERKRKEAEEAKRRKADEEKKRKAEEAGKGKGKAKEGDGPSKKRARAESEDEVSDGEVAEKGQKKAKRADIVRPNARFQPS